MYEREREREKLSFFCCSLKNVYIHAFHQDLKLFYLTSKKRLSLSNDADFDHVRLYRQFSWPDTGNPQLCCIFCYSNCVFTWLYHIFFIEINTSLKKHPFFYCYFYFIIAKFSPNKLGPCNWSTLTARANRLEGGGGWWMGGSS